MRTIKYFLLIIFAFWWGLNFYFSFPKSSLPILYAHNLYKKWDNIFFQRWGFFAPPPDFDNRLYYVYTNKKDTSNIFIYEVFEKMNKRKNQNYLFNDNLINLDYILHNLSSPIGDLLRENYQIYKHQRFCDSITNETECYQSFINQSRNEIHQLSQMKTLLKHSKLIAHKQGLTNHKVRIILGAKKLPKFHQRYQDSITREENVFFSSDYFNFITNTWERSPN